MKWVSLINLLNLRAQCIPIGDPILYTIQFPFFLNATADDMPAKTENSIVFTFFLCLLQGTCNTNDQETNIIDGYVKLYAHSHIKI